MKTKFAIPLEEGVLCSHFGHCTQFAIIDTDGEKIIGKDIVIPPPHEPGLLPKWLSEKGVTHVIAGGMGKHAVDLFSQRLITVYTGAQPKEPEELVEDCLAGNLSIGGNTCDH
ncbi:MAG: ATPase [Bacteroidetes bacterium HGW-Bacteroidetes-10]|jgi:predicted Fe-Mo cluster-binding NifX family protein|nr:MAG: ATPase [Bacteroidetes bacterium HGW-Bacteroidetes-10]